jgi:hypothetical protein
MQTPYRKDGSQGFAHYVRSYSLFKSGRFITNIKLTLYKALIMSVMTYVCTSWDYVADAHLLNLQRLRNRVLHATGNQSANCT